MKTLIFSLIFLLILFPLILTAKDTNSAKVIIGFRTESTSTFPSLKIEGETGDKQRIYYSDDLEDWHLLGTVFTCLIPVTKVDKEAEGQTKRYYRLVKVPYEQILPEDFFIHPLPGKPITQGIHNHNAIDFGAPIGTPIYASASGEVVASKTDNISTGYGICVVIVHENETQTLYAHMSSLLVSIGENVEQGQVIGYVGNTGFSTGPHLHFEVYGAQNPFAP